MFGPKMHVMEGPLALAGGLIGGYIGGGSTLAGMATMAGLSGMAAGMSIGNILGGGMSPKMPKNQEAAAAGATPKLPATPAMPPTPGEMTPGQMASEKLRKGRLSTILTTPQSRLDTSTTDTGVERLGG